MREADAGCVAGRVQLIAQCEQARHVSFGLDVKVGNCLLG
jgi:hypothetical protein